VSLHEHRRFLTIRLATERVSPDVNPNAKSNRPIHEPSVRRKIKAAYESGKFKGDILNVANGTDGHAPKNDRFLVAEDKLFEILGARL